MMMLYEENELLKYDLFMVLNKMVIIWVKIEFEEM